MKYHVDNFETDEYIIASILSHLLEEARRVFGEDTIDGAPVKIFNLVDGKSPCFLKCNPEYHIILAVNDTECFAQIVYQLSHEICHYAICRASETDKVVRWLEETMCEAFSMAMLEYFAETWGDGPLFEAYSNYASAITRYLHNISLRKATNRLASCSTVDKLLEYESHAQDDRAARVNERNALFHAIVLDPTTARVFPDYRKYINSDGVTIDWNAWRADCDARIIRVLQSLQPVKGMQA